MNEVVGLVKRDCLEIGDRDGRAGKVIDPGFVVLIWQIQIPIHTCAEIHIACSTDI